MPPGFPVRNARLWGRQEGAAKDCRGLRDEPFWGWGHRALPVCWRWAASEETQSSVRSCRKEGDAFVRLKSGFNWMRGGGGNPLVWLPSSFHVYRIRAVAPGSAECRHGAASLSRGGEFVFIATEGRRRSGSSRCVGHFGGQ